jgi:hypothetical protein
MKDCIKFFCVILCGIMLSCSPKYFETPNINNILAYHMSGVQSSEYDKFAFELKPYKYFKNDYLTMSMFSDSSSFIKYGNNFYYGSKDGDFHKSEHSWRDDVFFQSNLYVESNFKNKLEKDRKIIITAAQMRKKYTNDGLEIEGGECRSFMVFVGKVTNEMNVNKPVEKYIFDQQARKKQTAMESKKVKTENAILAMMIKEEGHKIVMSGIIDIRFHNKGTSSEIYDFQQILKDDIWFVKR